MGVSKTAWALWMAEMQILQEQYHFLVGMGGAGELLVVDAKREAHLLEQCDHRAVADLDAELV